MTPAVLRQAAATLRELAAKAMPGPWAAYAAIGNHYVDKADSDRFNGRNRTRLPRGDQLLRCACRGNVWAEVVPNSWRSARIPNVPYAVVVSFDLGGDAVPPRSASTLGHPGLSV